MILPSYILVAFLFAHSAHGFEAFEPNCSSPRSHVTWVSPPAVRGTMDIIFSTFSVLLICTWAIQHLSVPPHKTHFWNHKIVKDARYSAFLDDARFNYTKLKWMGMSLLAPEYILAKALSEFLAAHDSRRQFVELQAAHKLPKQPVEWPGESESSKLLGKREWTTTHGYFANMGGFILRFNVEAVKLSLEPHQPDEFERSLFVRNPDDDPPYIPQDLLKAEARELEQCHLGKPCENHPHMFDTEYESSEGIRLESQSRPAPQAGDSENHPLLQVVVDSHAPTTSVETLNGAASPLESPFQPQGDEAILTPGTLVNQPEAPPSCSPTSLVNRHGYPMNATPTTATDDQQLPFSLTRQATHDDSDLELQPLHTEQSANPHEELQPNNHPTLHGEKERLIPHKKWQATWALSSMQMLYAIREGIIPLPDTTAEDLNDRSKGDALVKGLAVLHISWLVIQILARGVQGIAITQLEIMVLGFSACALVTYFLLFYKPQDVKVPTYIDIPHTLTRPQIIQLAARSPVATLMVEQFWLHGVAVRAMADNIFPWTPGIRFKLPSPLMKTPIFLNPHLIGIGGGGALFGGIHVAAWNFSFPTPVERLLWRISAGYLVSIPLVGVFIYWFVQHFTRRRRGGETDAKPDRILRPIGRVAIPLYLLARMYLLVEVFRCLAYPAPSTFDTVGWPSLIPHIS